MTYPVAIMFAVAAILLAVGTALLLRLRSPASERQVYAYRMIGIMAAAAGIALFFSAGAMWRWTVHP